MKNGDLTYDDFLSRLNIQDVLVDAGYHLNRRDGLRYPSYVRLDSDGRRIRGDKFIVTQGGKCCFQPPEQKSYNVISFIKQHPDFFADNRPGMSPDHLVNLVCNRLLNHPMPERETRIVQPGQKGKPFNLSDYDIHRFDRQDRDSQKNLTSSSLGGTRKSSNEFERYRSFARALYPYFKHRGIDLNTQRVFANYFCLATKHRSDGLSFANLAFPMTLPGDEKGKIIGFEERGRPRMDGSSSYKGKAEGSDSSHGLWIANLTGKPLSRATDILWFESAYDAMACYQICPSKSVFVSTGGNPTVGQMKGLLAETPNARHYLGFDKDDAGRQFVSNFRMIAAEMGFRSENVQAYHPLGFHKDWNDALLGKKDFSVAKNERSDFDYQKFMADRKAEEQQEKLQSSMHR